MAELTFDSGAFRGHLRTRRLGRALFVRAAVESTNDVAWTLAQDGAPDGACVVADLQTRGRGRQGRTWHTTPGRALALSLVLHPGCDRTAVALAPLVAGVALSRALETLGVTAVLKWPNDLLVEGRKISGILVESRRDTGGAEIVIMGVGVNVAQNADEFPAELRDRATSIALAGSDAGREQVAAEFLNALEPAWDEHQEGDPRRALDAWRDRAKGFWGQTVSVASPAGNVAGVARDLDERGGLVIEQAGGRLVTVVAGDLDLAPQPSEAPEPGGRGTRA